MDQRSRTTVNVSRLVLGGGAVSGVIGLLAWALDGVAAGLVVGCLGAGYVTCGLLLSRSDLVLPRWTLTAASALAAAECLNVAVEHVGSLGLAAVVGAGTMGALVLSASWASVAGGGGRRVVVGLAAAVGVVGVGMLVSTTVVLASAFVARVVVGPARAGSFAGTLSNAQLHLLLPVLVAVSVGAMSAVANRALGSVSRSAQAAVAIGAAVLLTMGASLLIRASGLPRDQRPAWVVPGMAAAALGLTLLPSGVYALVRRERAAYPRMKLSGGRK